MSEKNERMMILEMLAEGKISPEEATRLLEAVGAKATGLGSFPATPRQVEDEEYEDEDEDEEEGLPFGEVTTTAEDIGKVL
ncbi:MAG: hypothetical protein FWF06_07485, partial [Symbiobacteriaceae bacterium]|nr:hypothetical protein [Symbiobacteriaceae bacterium]